MVVVAVSVGAWVPGLATGAVGICELVVVMGALSAAMLSKPLAGTEVACKREWIASASPCSVASQL